MTSFSMPMPNACDAPKFTSDPSGFDAFFEDLSELAQHANLSLSDVIQWAGCYAGEDCVFWPTRSDFVCLAEFQVAVSALYSTLDKTHDYTAQDLVGLIHWASNCQDKFREVLGTYYRLFLYGSAYLMERFGFSGRERGALYLQGFPQPLRARVLHRLAVTHPDVLPDDGYEFLDVHEAIVFVFTAGIENVATPEPTSLAPQSQHSDSFDDLVSAFAESIGSNVPAVVRTFCVKTPIIVAKHDIKMVGMISDIKTVGSRLTQKLWEGH